MKISDDLKDDVKISVLILGVVGAWLLPVLLPLEQVVGWILLAGMAGALVRMVVGMHRLGIDINPFRRQPKPVSVSDAFPRATERARDDWITAAETWHATFPDALAAFNADRLSARDFENFVRAGDRLSRLLSTTTRRP